MADAIKILCVDDEKNVLRALQRLFMDEDYRIFTAETGEEGLAILAAEEDLQLIISDYRMPGMDGVEFLKIANERRPATIRIVLSGYADTASVVAAINDGHIYKFIPKPWNDEELLLTIKKALEVYFLRQKNEDLATRLMAANDELKRFNEDLEEEIRKRTAELTFQNKAMRLAHNVMNALPVAVIGLEPGGLIVMSNKLAENLLGAGQGPLLGSDSARVFGAELRNFGARIKDAGQADSFLAIGGGNFMARGVKILTDQGQEGIIMAFIPAAQNTGYEGESKP
jgi:two-component system NtrC family sensor kinase